MKITTTHLFLFETRFCSNSFVMQACDILVVSQVIVGVQQLVHIGISGDLPF